MAGFLEDRNGPLSTGRRPFTLSDGLKRLSSFGMYFDDMVLRQSQAIGPTEDAFGYGQMNPLGVDNDDIYSAFAALSMTDTNMRKQLPFFDQNYKRRGSEEAHKSCLDRQTKRSTNEKDRQMKRSANQKIDKPKD